MALDREEMELIIEAAIERAIHRRHLVTIPILVFLLNRQTGIIMSDIDALSTALSDLSAAVTDASNRVSADLAVLHAQIDALVADKGAAAALHDAVGAVQAQVAALGSIGPSAPPAAP